MNIKNHSGNNIAGKKQAIINSGAKDIFFLKEIIARHKIKIAIANKSDNHQPFVGLISQRNGLIPPDKALILVIWRKIYFSW